jgi:hypothetical protein
MEVPFLPESLANAGLSDRIFDIIPGSRSKILGSKDIKKIGSTTIHSTRKATLSLESQRHLLTISMRSWCV